MFYHEDCRWFTGYKPCQYKRECRSCNHYKPVKTRIAIVSLEAMGAVLRTTCLLNPIKRKYENCHITWITYSPSKALLEKNPFIDRLMELNSQSLPALHYLKFDVAFGVDKSIEAGALVESLNAERKFGFGLDRNGVIRPLNSEAHYQYDVGLNDDLKFYKNEKPETQQITESMGLKWIRDPYVLHLSQAELDLAAFRRKEILKISPGAKGIIGFNTGCSKLFPYKKFTITKSIELIMSWRKKFENHCILLLGGKEDEERQEAIKSAFKDDGMVVNAPTNEGLRSGIIWMQSVDLVFSGCSLGMHMAIGLRKKVIAWFGVSCIQEIDLYDNGIKLQTDVGCSPCWKKSCDQEKKCFDHVDPSRILHATQDLLGHPSDK